MAIFDSWGVRHPVTVLQLDECEVVQVGGGSTKRLGVAADRPGLFRITRAIRIRVTNTCKQSGRLAAGRHRKRENLDRIGTRPRARTRRHSESAIT